MWFIIVKIFIIVTLFIDLVGYMVRMKNSEKKKTKSAIIGSAVGIILGVITRAFALHLIWISQI